VVEVITGFAVAAGKEGGKWLDAILARRRNRKVASAAHLLYHAGIVVAELRGLRDRMQELFVPLAMFNPEDWDAERRRSWVDELQTFAQSGPAFGAMDEHASALRELPAEDAETFRDTIVELAANVTHLGETDWVSDRPSEAWQQDVAEYQAHGREEWGDATFQSGPGSPDVLIQNSLPALLWLVRHGEDRNEIERLRALARGLLVTRSRRADEKLADVVRQAEETFGKLTGRVVGRYPEIPIPTWATQ
jgi:hypothetical protein